MHDSPIQAGANIPVRVVIVTLDNHMASAVDRAFDRLKRELPGLRLTLHAVTGLTGNPKAAEKCRKDIETADFVIANMLFLEEHIRLVGPWLEARREQCDCLIGCLSAAEIVRLTQIGDFSMSNPTGGVFELLKKLRGRSKKPGAAGKGQMKLLRSIPRLLKYIPGKAQHVRAYFLGMQYLLAASDDNIVNMVRFLVQRYASGPRAELRNTIKPDLPAEYPDTGLYHPKLPNHVTDSASVFDKHVAKGTENGTVGLLIMRSYLLARNTAHYDGVIEQLEARGLRVIPAFASGLDSRPAIQQYFMQDGKASVDCVISLTGFSLVGGPAYNDSSAAEAMLAELDVPYLSAFATEFQTLEDWQKGDHGLTPVETTIMMALPEIDGATGPMLFGGRSNAGDNDRDMCVEPERAAMLAARAQKLVALRRKRAEERKVAIVLYNFPPNGGATGTAAFLDVFQSLHNTLLAMRKDGYDVGELPSSASELRDSVLGGNAEKHGTDANVAKKIPAEEHVRGLPWLDEIEKQWGPAPGRQQSDGSNIFVLGKQFGQVFVGIQPAFGYEGDPMRLLFEKGFAPTHAFAAFYRYLRDDFRADALMHFGTHGALEFMPGKQTALSGECWPDRLISDMPNIYLYAANNPSEGTIARRRSAATLVSYMTPPIGRAGLYKGLMELKHALDRWRSLPPGEKRERDMIADVIIAQAQALDLADENSFGADHDREFADLGDRLMELETTLIPHGLHVLGKVPERQERVDLLQAVNEGFGADAIDASHIEQIVDNADASETNEARDCLVELNRNLSNDHETPALMHALSGGFIRPVSGGDIVRSPQIAPTGRNVHGFDPFRLPTAVAMADGKMQADLLVKRLHEDHGKCPTRIAMVLWGTDNLKSEGGPIGQVLALIGAKPRFDSFGRLAGADLVSLEELGRPRIDVVVTLSGIFRDLLPLQTKLLAEASLKAAQAEEPAELNPIRAHALQYAKEHDCDLETAAMRVFSNASGAYGSNVNMLVESGAWDDEDELGEAYTSRKSFAYGVDGNPVQQKGLLGDILKNVEAAYQNVESAELGITSIDHYFDTLGGISRAIRKSGGADIPVYVGDQTSGKGKVRSLDEQVALETRTRMLNPKFYEALLDHGYEGVRQIESHVTNTLGWSATTGQVAPWVYKNITETFVLDEKMRRRLAELNPKASMKLANRLIEAKDRNYWLPDDETWRALLDAGEELEDRLEGITAEAAA